MLLEASEKSARVSRPWYAPARADIPFADPSPVISPFRRSLVGELLPARGRLRVVGATSVPLSGQRQRSKYFGLQRCLAGGRRLVPGTSYRQQSHGRPPSRNRPTVP